MKTYQTRNRYPPEQTQEQRSNPEYLHFKYVLDTQTGTRRFSNNTNVRFYYKGNPTFHP